MGESRKRPCILTAYKDFTPPVIRIPPAAKNQPEIAIMSKSALVAPQ
jgi:hypothetical protein